MTQQRGEAEPAMIERDSTALCETEDAINSVRGVIDKVTLIASRAKIPLDQRIVILWMIRSRRLRQSAFCRPSSRGSFVHPPRWSNRQWEHRTRATNPSATLANVRAEEKQREKAKGKNGFRKCRGRSRGERGVALTCERGHARICHAVMILCRYDMVQLLTGILLDAGNEARSRILSDILSIPARYSAN